jgi:hypothetical protein
MKLEDTCLTIEQAKKLKKLGINFNNSLECFYGIAINEKGELFKNINYDLCPRKEKVDSIVDVVPTLTNTEMLEMLPKEITPMEDGYLMPYSLFYDGHSLGYIEWWGKEKGRYKINILEDGDYPNEEEIYLKKWNLRDALFEIIKWLKINKLI